MQDTINAGNKPHQRYHKSSHQALLTLCGDIPHRKYPYVRDKPYTKYHLCWRRTLPHTKCHSCTREASELASVMQEVKPNTNLTQGIIHSGDSG